ncbi:MAG TPA: NUDIX domain-containing protein [Chitinophagaceae bacterium]|nr:NUDIX domain-containing protein [Chitinophagaceae bacterium]
MQPGNNSANLVLHTAGLLLIREKRLLMAYSRNKQCFYLPGGKISESETAAEGLCREIAEELNVLINPEDLHFYAHISAPAFGETAGVIMEQDCFRLFKTVQPMAAAEIEELRYFSLEDYRKEDYQAPGALSILEKLKADNLVD